MRTLLVGAAIAASVAIPWVGAANAQDGTPSPAPTAVGTPWPAPRNLRVDQSTSIVGPEGQYLSPADRTWTVVLAWEAETGFGGVFEVERSDVDPDGERLPFARIATTPAGAPRYQERFPFWALNAERCYRVRTVIDGEAGPYSNEACTSRPPAEGHGGVPDDAPFFFPPEVSMRLITEAPGGSPLPEGEREAEITVTWREFPGFEGVFEVERAKSYDIDAKLDFEFVATLPAGERRFVERFPAGELQTGPRCYRVRTLFDDAYGPYTPLNCYIRPPGPGPIILLPPTGMRMEITRAAPGSAAAIVSWAPAAGYLGRYEVERAQVPFSGDFGADRARIEAGPFAHVAFATPDQPRFREEFPAVEEFTVIRCYRVRAVVDGAEGPFGRLACTVPPPHGPAPRPPDAGSGVHAAPPAYTAMLPLLAAGIASLGAAVLCGLAHRRSRQMR